MSSHARGRGAMGLPYRISLLRWDERAALATESWIHLARSDMYGRAHARCPERAAGAGEYGIGTAQAREFRLYALAGLPVGLLSYEMEGDRLWIHELATTPAYRDRGLGAEAVYALEEETGAASAAALIPAGNGLAIYFWLRAGYRPVFNRASMTAPHTVMVRDLRDAVLLPASFVAR